MKFHNDTEVRNNGPDEGNIPFLPLHLITATLSRKLKYTAVDHLHHLCFHLYRRALDYNELPTTSRASKQSLSVSFRTLPLIRLYRSIIGLYRSGNTVLQEPFYRRAREQHRRGKFGILWQIRARRGRHCVDPLCISVSTKGGVISSEILS